MPLQHLIDSLNLRFVADSRLDAQPFSFDGKQVHGRFGNLKFTSQLKPIRLFVDPNIICGHDTAPLVFSPESFSDNNRLLYGEEIPNIVSLDRLSRTVHMLNYLVLDKPDGRLFLHVHPHHILTVKRDHGAYFEDIIESCGLPLRRVVIELTIGTVYESQLQVLLERLGNYKDRGYATSVKIDEHVGNDFVERYRAQYLPKFRPDHVRFNAGFLERAYQGRYDQLRRTSLLSAIRQLDTKIIASGIKSDRDASLIHEEIKPDYVQGGWYEQGASSLSALRKAG